MGQWSARDKGADHDLETKQYLLDAANSPRISEQVPDFDQGSKCSKFQIPVLEIPPCLILVPTRIISLTTKKPCPTRCPPQSLCHAPTGVSALGVPTPLTPPSFLFFFFFFGATTIGVFPILPIPAPRTLSCVPQVRHPSLSSASSDWSQNILRQMLQM